MVNETAAIKAGALSALVAYLGGAHNINVILIVGIIGGIAYIGKEIAIAKEPPTMRSLLRLPFSALMAIAMTGVIYYGGTDGFNRYIKDLGHPVWIFLSFMAALNYRVISDAVAIVFKAAVETASQYFGGDRRG